MYNYSFFKKITLLFVFILFFIPIVQAQNNLSKDKIKSENKNSQFHGKGEFWRETTDNKKLIFELMSQMSEQEMIAQIFLLAWEGENPDKKFFNLIKDKKIGGVKIFGWNYSSIKNLITNINRVQKASQQTRLSIPLVIATDQEGGWIRHIKETTSTTPGNMALGASGLTYDSYKTGLYIGQELKLIGINCNLAPSVDLYRNHRSQIIGSRSFSSNPNLAARLGVAYFKGFEGLKIITAAKHYPGHGNTALDSHGRIPVIADNLENLKKLDLLPYQRLVKEGIPAIMVGHLNYPTITKNDKPATLSSTLIDILRNQIKFNGVLISDDISMTSLKNYSNKKGWTFAELIINSVNAGINLILSSNLKTFDNKTWNALLDEYKKKEQFYINVKNSVEKILELKIKYLKAKDRVPLVNDISNSGEIFNSKRRNFFQSQALRAATVIKGKEIPVKIKNSDKVLIITADQDFIKATNIFLNKYDIYKVTYSPPMQKLDKNEIAKIRQKAKDYDKIILNFTTLRSFSALTGLKDLKEKIYVIAGTSPAFLEETPWVENAISVYGWYLDEYKAAYSVLFGNFEATGKLPFLMNK